jgi:hypothetical protein
MKQDYLTPFLKHLSLKMPSPVSDSVEIDKKEEASVVIELVGGGGDEKLAGMIINAIKLGLKQSNKYLEAAAKRNKKIQADKEKIKRISMTNGIDMNYGGGLLVFGPNFKIEKMIHMFYDKQTPMYFSTSVEDTMEDDVVIDKISDSEPYMSTTIAEEIKKIINNPNSAS